MPPLSERLSLIALRLSKQVPRSRIVSNTPMGNSSSFGPWTPPVIVRGENSAHRGATVERPS